MEAKQDVNVFYIILGKLLKVFATVSIFSFRLVIYFLDLTILLLSNILEKLVLENWGYWKEKYLAEEEEPNYQIQVIEGNKHEYIFHRTKEYDLLYEDLKSNIEVTQDGTSLVLDYEISKDIITKLDRILYLSEREALKQGYKFAKETRGEIEQSEVYNKYIVSQVFKGE